MILSLFNKSLASLSDEELMERVSAKGDDRAYEELYHRHSRRVMGFLLRQLRGDSDRAADITQDIFLKVWSNREKYINGNTFKTWLFAIAYNLLKNEYRHMEIATVYAQQIKQTSIAHHDEDFSTTLDNDAFDEALRQILRTLDADGRMLFSLRFEEEMTVPQIAEIMGIPDGTVKSRQHTLTKTLKEKLSIYEVRR